MSGALQGPETVICEDKEAVIGRRRDRICLADRRNIANYSTWSKPITVSKKP